MVDEGFIISVILIGVFIVIGIFMLIVLREVFGMLSRGRRQNQARQHGVPALATILKVWQTGRATGEEVVSKPELGLLLEVQPTTGAPFQAQAATFVQMWDMQLWRVGARVEIKYDPKDLSKIAVERLVG